MLVIRTDQKKILAASSAVRFERELALHVNNFAPELAQVAGDRRIHSLVRSGLESAKAYGLTTRGSLRFYIEMALLFGASFDRDPQYPWAAELLKESGGEIGRMDRLYRKTSDYLDKVAGKNSRYAIEALRRIHRAELPVLVRSDLNPGNIILRLLTLVYPEKAGYIGDTALRALILAAGRAAVQKQIGTREGVIVLACLMFAFGHGVLEDPMYPWVAATLEQPPAEPSQTVQRLADKSRAYVSAAIENLSRIR